MEPEFKTYLEERFDKIDKKFDSLEEDIRAVAQTTATIIDTMESNHHEIMDAHMQRINGVENRMDRAEDKIRIIETKLA